MVKKEEEEDPTKNCGDDEILLNFSQMTGFSLVTLLSQQGRKLCLCHTNKHNKQNKNKTHQAS